MNDNHMYTVAVMECLNEKTKRYRSTASKDEMTQGLGVGTVPDTWAHPSECANISSFGMPIV